MTVETPIASTPAVAKRFAFILPLAFITYGLAYLDRVNVGFGGAGGMAKTLHWQDWQFTLFNSSFFVGYLLLQIPGTGYAARKSVRWLMFWALVLWGIIAPATALLHNFTLLLIDRFLLGAVEGVVFPSLLVFLTHWFTRRERSKANAILILGNPLTLLWASIASGALVDHFDRHPLGRLAGWQVMLLVEGLPTLLWAVAWLILARDFPPHVSWLTEDEAAEVQRALDAEQARLVPISDYWIAFRDRRLILICFQFFAWSIGIYGLNMWLPLITRQGSNLGMTNVGLLNAIPYLFAAAAMWIVSVFSDRWQIRRAFVWPFLLVGAAAFLVSYFAGANHFWLAFLGLILAAVCMYAPYGPFWAMVPEMLSRNVIGQSLALINTIGAAGGFLGTLGVGALHELTGGYGASFACLSACLLIAGALTFATRPNSAQS